MTGLFRGAVLISAGLYLIYFFDPLGWFFMHRHGFEFFADPQPVGLYSYGVIAAYMVAAVGLVTFQNWARILFMVLIVWSYLSQPFFHSGSYHVVEYLILSVMGLLDGFTIAMMLFSPVSRLFASSVDEVTSDRNPFLLAFNKLTLRVFCLSLVAVAFGVMGWLAYNQFSIQRASQEWLSSDYHLRPEITISNRSGVVGTVILRDQSGMEHRYSTGPQTLEAFSTAAGRYKVDAVIDGHPFDGGYLGLGEGQQAVIEVHAGGLNIVIPWKQVWDEWENRGRNY